MSISIKQCEGHKTNGCQIKMPSLRILFSGLWSFLLCAVVTSTLIDEAVDATSLQFEVPENRYIIEFETSYSDVQEDFNNQSLEVSVNNRFDSPAFLGMSVQVQNGNEFTLNQIQSLASVKNVWQASYVTLEFNTTNAENQIWNPHVVTGVDTLHDRKIFGDGIRIAVVDSGLDVNHEAFRNKKIEGYDFTENPQNPKATFEDIVGHGTFVSSVIIGDSENMKGVAPQASLKMYKVFGKHGTTTDDIILAALLKAYSESPDVISLSLGSDRGYPSMPISIVASKIAESIPIVFAAGNSGIKGPYTASSGASGKGVIAVASMESTQLIVWPATLTSSSGRLLDFRYIGNKGSKIEVNGVYDVDFIGNACHIPTTSRHTSKKVLMGIRGTCRNSQLLDEFQGFDYAGSIMFVSQAEMHVIDIRPQSTQMFFGLATNKVRNWVKEEVSHGSSVSVKFNQDAIHTAIEKTDDSAGLINSFTSWGPTFDLDFYPHVVAPGGNVFGAKVGGGYFISSGTSYACPYVAGVLALYLSEFGRVDPQVLRKRVIGSSKLLSLAYSSGYIDYSKTKVEDEKFAPLIQQGNGLIDAESLWNTNTSLLSAPYILLNDTENRSARHQIEIVNDGKYEVTYRFSHRAMETVYTREPKKQYVSNYWPQLVDCYPEIHFSEMLITLSPGGKGTVLAEIVPPKSLDLNKAPIFQGTIDITGSNGDRITVPYIGSEFIAKDWTPFTDAPVLLINDKGKLRRPYENEKFQTQQLREIGLFYAVRFATMLYSFDIVDENYNLKSFEYPPISGKEGYHGPLRVHLPASNTSLRYPVSFLPISSRLSFVQLQSFANGTSIPQGKYRLLCRALKTFGNPTNALDWQMYLTDAFLVEASGVSESRYDRIVNRRSKYKARTKRNDLDAIQTLYISQNLQRRELQSKDSMKAHLSVVLDAVPYSTNTTSTTLSALTWYNVCKSSEQVQSQSHSLNQATIYLPYLLLSILSWVLPLVV